jgi:hypothetical protein
VFPQILEHPIRKENVMRKISQVLAAALIIVDVSSIAGAGADGGGRGDQNVCGSNGIYGQAVSCLDKYEKSGVEVYCVTANVNGMNGSDTAVSCDWEHAKHPDNK